MTAAGSAGEAVTPGQADGPLLSDYLRERGRPWAAAMIERAEVAARVSRMTPGQAATCPVAFTPSDIDTAPDAHVCVCDQLDDHTTHHCPTCHVWWVLKSEQAAIAAQQPQPARSLDGLMPMGLHFDDADPVARCLVKDCQWHGHGDAMVDATRAWTMHLGEAHRRDWPDDDEGEQPRDGAGPASLPCTVCAEVGGPHGVPQPAPELAAAMRETAEVRDGYAKLCEEFSDSPQSGQSARISLTVLNRHRVRAGLEALKPRRTGLT